MSTPDRNIVLITSDSLRADHCGFVNERMETTATLDRMANDGVVFENAIAPGPRTLSSMPEIFTGEILPDTRGDLSKWAVRNARITEHMAAHETLAQKLNKQGYTTAAYTTNPWTTEETKFDSGFDFFQEVEHGSSRVLADRFGGTVFTPLVWLSKWVHKEAWFSQWPTFYEDILDTVSGLSTPYFLWVFLLDTHTPFIVPRRDRIESSTLGMYYSVLKSNGVFGENTGMSYFREDIPSNVESHVKQAYRDSIRSVDRFVHTLWDDLAADDPVFMFHSDHGEAFNEHGTYGHQQVVYEENIHVPLIIYNADVSVKVDEPISLRVLPEMVTSYANDGRLNPVDWTSDYAIARTEDSSTMAVRSERWKYISSGTTEELYDLVDDPEERHDVLEAKSETAEELRAVLESYKTAIPEQDLSRDQQDEPDADLKNRLESLGYLG